MSVHISAHDQHSPWWTALSLHTDGDPVVERVLREHPPLGFISDTDSSMPLDVATLASLCRAAVVEAHHQDLADRSAHRAINIADFESAFTRPDADVVVDEGAWVGFTHGEAAAWCWNLLHYEGEGLSSIGAVLRSNAIKALRAGELPEVFDYPRRAREIADRGVTAREYRRAKEIVGAPMFNRKDARRR